MMRPLLFVSVAAASFASIPLPLEAQYFGRNKVQYDHFDFRILETPNYRIHFYPEAAESIEDAARMAERWYERIARVFEFEVGARRPLILYANHPDFQQTNVLRGTIGEATGGVTEGLRDRVIMPLGSSYADTDHVLGHELVHSFQFEIARGRQGAGLQGLMQLPLWFVEGQAEYISVGPASSLTGMWMRDALLRDEFPTLRQMTREMQRYFPYRFGHAFWAFVGGAYGDHVIGPMLRMGASAGWEASVRQVLGVDPDSLSVAWERATVAHYGPIMEGRTPPGEAGTLLLSPETGAGRQNIAPALSPDGRYVAFLSERDLFTTELFLADARTGEIIRALTSTIRDAHFDAIRFIDSAGGWSPDGRSLAIVVFAEGRNRIQIHDVEDRSVRRRIELPREIGEIRGPEFSPDGTRLVFSGQAGGRTDLYIVEIEGGEVTRLTDDRHAALQPTFSPDGGTIAFVTDLGPDTNFDRLTFGPKAIGLYDVATGEITRLAPFQGADHWTPRFTPDGAGLYFLADPDGFRDIYRVALADGQTWQVTRLATAVSGITDATPALTVARETGTVAFSIFDGGEFHIYGLDAVAAEGRPVTSGDVVAAAGRRLPGAPAPGEGRVGPLLADAGIGLASPGTYQAVDADTYSPSLGLEFIGQASVGVGADRFGTYYGGAISALFSDMLGNRNLYAALQAQGELRDIGGQLFYQNLERRWDWGAGVSHIPIRYFRTAVFDPGAGGLGFVRLDERIRVSEATGLLSYPFSGIRRAEFQAGYTRYGFDRREEIFIYDAARRLIEHERRDLEAPDPLNLAQVSAAFVEDNSFFGFTSPVRGWRGRYEVSQTMGSIDFTQVIFDHRRYLAPAQHLTLAVRGMHIGRYGGADRDLDGVIRPFFLGVETLVRGYASHTFEVQECTPTPEGQCAEFDRLLGHRIGVLNLEARIPVLGTDRFGLLSFPMLPMELALFTDAGVAWSAGDGAELTWDRESAERIPVVSSGVSTRWNIFGAMILEVFYVVPWQRPERGGHFGFALAPGW